jgi:hypothetical protein
LTASQQQVYRSALNDDDGGNFLGFIPASQQPAEEISTQALPRLAVDAQGDLVAIWYDMRRDPNSSSPTLMDVYGSTSTDGGQTWSANYRITTVSFNATTGGFTDAAGKADIFLGDYLALAAGGGMAFAAWTDTRNGNQDIYFSRYPIVPPPAAPGDRYEPNNDPNSNATTTNLGSVSVQRIFPRLTVTGGDDDWYKVTASSTGTLTVSLQDSSPLQLELYDFNGNLLATGTNILDAPGHVIGQQASTPSSNIASKNPYYLHVFGVPVGGATVSYTMTVSALTANLGTQVHGTQSAVPLPSGAIHRYTLTAAVTGTVEVTVTIPTPSTGTVTFQVQNGTATTVLGTAQIKGTATSAHLSIPVTQGQTIVLIVTGATATYTLDYTNQDQFQSSKADSGTVGLFFPTLGTPTAIAVADLNGDGHPDVVTASLDPNNPVNVVLNDGTGLLGAPRGYLAGPAGANDRKVVLDDFSGDSVPYVAVSNYQSSDVSVLFTRPDGTLAPERRFDAVSTADSLASGDFNGDGIRDLVVLERLPQNGNLSQLAVLFGRADGTFAPPLLLGTTFAHGGISVVVGDFNGDHKDDIIAFSNNDPTIEEFLSNGAGAFAPMRAIAGPENVFTAVAGDLNKDQKMDLVLGGTNSGNVYVLLGNGDGSFQPGRAFFANTDPLKAATRIGGLVVSDLAGPTGAPDGIPDIVVVAIPIVGGSPQINLLQGNGPGAGGAFGGFSGPFQLLTGNFTGPLAVADLNGDTFPDILAADSAGGVRVLYNTGPNAFALVVPPSTTLAPRNLGPVVHMLTPTAALSPSFTDAYYKFTVPTETVAGAGDEVIDISTTFQFVSGAGLSMEVDANGKPLPGAQILEQFIAPDGSGARFRIRAPQGEVLTLHIHAGAGGAGAYTTSIDVLPQVVSIAAPPLFPGAAAGTNGGPVNSSIITLQGDRLDPTTAQNPANYTVTWAGPDGVFGTADDQVIPIAAAGGGQPVLYDRGANPVPNSSGRTFPATVNQTITLYFANPLPPGSYRVKLNPAIQSAPFNANETGLLVTDPNPADPKLTGHPVVSLPGGNLMEGSLVEGDNLVLPSGPVGDLSVFNRGTAFLTQFHANAGSLLNSLQQTLGDSNTITPSINNQAIAGIGPIANGMQVMVIWLDPVSIDMADPQGARTTFNLRTNTVANNLTNAFIETGGNIEVMVLAGLTGTFTLNLSDVQPTARGGVVIFDEGQVQSVALTDAIRGGTRTFDLTIGERVVASNPVSGSGTLGAVERGRSAATNEVTTTQPLIVFSQPQSGSGGSSSTEGTTGPAGSGEQTAVPIAQGEGSGMGSGVAVQNVPAVSAVLAVSVVLQSGAVTTLTIQEGPGGAIEINGPGLGPGIVISGAQAVGGKSDARDSALPGSRSPDALRAALERTLNEIAQASVIAVSGVNPMVMSVLQALLQAIRSGQLGRPGVAPPPGPGAQWVDPQTDPVIPAAWGEELTEVWLTEEEPSALTSLLGFGMLAAGLCRPWWGDDPEGRRARESLRRQSVRV